MRDSKQVPEFPPWAVSAYGIAVKHGYLGTEKEFALSLLGRNGIDMQPMILVSEESEEDVPDDCVLLMRPSSGRYAYYTAKNEFRAADLSVTVPDGLALTGRTLNLTCGGEGFGTGTELPETDLPEVTASDNGKVMKVVAGAWAAGTL